MIRRCLTEKYGFTLLEILIGTGLLLFVLVYILRIWSTAEVLANDNHKEIEGIYLAQSAMEIIVASVIDDAESESDTKYFMPADPAVDKTTVVDEVYVDGVALTNENWTINGLVEYNGSPEQVFQVTVSVYENAEGQNIYTLEHTIMIEDGGDGEGGDGEGGDDDDDDDDDD